MDPLRISIREDESWRERCNEKIEELIRKNVFSPGGNEKKEEDAFRLDYYVMENLLLNFEIYKAIEEGDPDKFVHMLEDVCEKEKLPAPEIWYQTTHGGDTMLHVAAKYGNEKIAELVASHCPDLLVAVNMEGNTALHDAAQSTEGGSNVISVILAQEDAWPEEQVKYITRSKNRVGNTALHEAVLRGYIDGVIELYQRDKAVAHQLNNTNKSPLYIAVYNYMRWNDNIVKTNQSEEKNKNAEAIVNYLLQDSLVKNKPDPKWNHGQSPLHAAIDAVSDEKREQSIGNIIAKGLRRWKMFGFDRATTEAKNSSKGLEEWIPKRPEMIYIKDENGRTPLHYAALRGYLDGVRIMLKYYPQAALVWDVYGNLPIHLACKSGNIDVVEELCEQECPYVGGWLNQKGQSILHIAGMEGKHDVVKYILTSKNLEINLNKIDRDGNTPLHVASKNMYPMVLFYLTRDERIDLQCQNAEGLMARDIVLQRSQWPRTYREVLCHAILSSAKAICNKEVYKELQSQHDKVQMKDLVNTLMLVAILITTVTFAAGFTVPGSVYGSDNPNPQQRGVAVLARRTVFQIFMVCNTVAMYSSAVGSFLLLWAQLGDYHLARNSFNFALHMVAWALLTTSGAFMAAAHLVVHNVSWLTILIRSMGAISILFILSAYVLFIFPLESDHPLLRPISRIFIRILIPFAGSYESP